MQTLELLIQEQTSGGVRPVAIVVDAPVSALIPALVEELHLPRATPTGRQLVYILRSGPNGRILPDGVSLRGAGIQAGAMLTLDSYAVQGSVGMLMSKTQVRADSSFYSATTLDDHANFPALDKHTSGHLPIVPAVQKKRKPRWTRRAFLVGSLALLGASSVGLGYGAYRAWLNGQAVAMNLTTAQHPPVQSPVVQPTTTIPTMAQPVFTFTQHQQALRAVAWAPNGTMLASGDTGAHLFLWNPAGNVQLRLQQPGSVHAIAWSPDKQQLATGAGNQVTFLDALTGTTLAQSAHQHTGGITSLAWAPSSQYVVSGAVDKQAIVWNATSHSVQTIFTGHTTPVESASWAADGQTIASSSQGGVVRVWNALTGQEVHGYFFDGATPLRALAFAPTGMQLAVGGDDGVVRLWNGLSCQQQGQADFGKQCMDTPQRLHAHTGFIRALAWSPDARLLATAGEDGMLAIWYPARQQTPLFHVRQQNPIRALAWSPNGKQIATGSGNTVTIWTLA